MMMPGRKFSAGSRYRYGFNGKENDNEVKGESNELDYGMRVSDPRLGRFLSVDPLTKDFPWYTPYQFAGNTPIQAIDRDGKEEFHFVKVADAQVGKTAFVLIKKKDIIDSKIVPTTEWRIPRNINDDGLIQVHKQITETNKRQEYIVHQQRIGYIDGVDGGLSGQQKVHYDATERFSSYQDMIDNKNGVDGNEKIKFYLSVGARNAHNENKANGGAGMFVNLGGSGVQAVRGALGVAETTAENLPTRLVRVIEEKYANSTNLGAAGAEDVFVTEASQLKGLTTSSQVAEKLTLKNSDGTLMKGPFRLIEFDTPSSGLAQPFNRGNPGFVNGGTTAGGATEYVVPNLKISDLKNVIQKTIK